MAKGGARIGAGRKSISEEVNSRELAMSALVKKYGGKEEALIALLNSDNPILIKFVYEHGFGKPLDKIEHSGNLNITEVTFE